jgi:hypothetical protein
MVPIQEKVMKYGRKQRSRYRVLERKHDGKRSQG